MVCSYVQSAERISYGKDQDAAGDLTGRCHSDRVQSNGRCHRRMDVLAQAGGVDQGADAMEVMSRCHVNGRCHITEKEN